ncbi:hypothetical protein [Runella rosea]|nr:hypothetical protein [Runella rosea]
MTEDYELFGVQEYGIELFVETLYFSFKPFFESEAAAKRRR